MEEINTKAYIEGLENALKNEKNKSLSLSQAVSTANSITPNDSIIRFRLELDKEKSKLEHFFAGDVKVFDDKLGEIWIENPEEAERTFNKRGVRLLVEQLEIFTMKNTLLSSYDLDRINNILQELGYTILDFIYNNAEELGMDSEYKQSKLKLTLVTILFTIESVYRRAFGGAESNTTAPNLSVHQIDNANLNRMPLINNQGSKEWKWV